MRTLALLLPLAAALAWAEPAAAQAAETTTATAPAIDPALEATARARLREADRLGRIADQIRIAPPRRVTTVAKMSEWIRRSLTPTLRRKMAAVQAARTAYEAVVTLGPTTSSVRAMRRLGDLIHGLALAIDRMPTPLEIQRDPQLLTIYRDTLSSQVAPFYEQAATAYEACLRRATEHGVTGPDVDAAREALELIRGTPLRRAAP